MDSRIHLSQGPCILECVQAKSHGFCVWILRPRTRNSIRPGAALLVFYFSPSVGRALVLYQRMHAWIIHFDLLFQQFVWNQIYMRTTCQSRKLLMLTTARRDLSHLSQHCVRWGLMELNFGLPSLLWSHTHVRKLCKDTVGFSKHSSCCIKFSISRAIRMAA